MIRNNRFKINKIKIQTFAFVEYKHPLTGGLKSKNGSGPTKKQQHSLKVLRFKTIFYFYPSLCLGLGYNQCRKKKKTI